MHRFSRGNLLSVVFGLTLVVGGLYAYGAIERGLEFSREAAGVVADVVYESVTKKGRMHPVVRYRTADGAEVVGQSQRHHNVQPGERVQIVYDVRNPREIEVGTLERTRHRRLVPAVAAIAIGGAGILGALALQFGAIRRFHSRE